MKPSDEQIKQILTLKEKILEKMTDDDLNTILKRYDTYM